MHFTDLNDKISNISTTYKTVEDVTKSNIRPSALEVGQWYVMFIYHLPKSESPYMLVKFVGSGTEKNKSSTNIKLVDVKPGEYYWFEAYDNDDKEFYHFGAHVFENKLCVTEKSKRISFKNLKEQPK